MYIHWLDEIDPEQELLVGGKAKNLARLLRSGIPVPPGFCVNVQAYQDLANRLGFEATARHLLDGLNPDDFRQLSSVSAALQELFLTAESMPRAWQEVAEAYAGLGRKVDSLTPSVAVRSSATAEDLPEHSFAGQHDSYLGVIGHQSTQGRVRQCWASLWNPQAIHYRHTRGIDHYQVSMAVVVQPMIPATCAGVLFTANPVTGNRSEALINASWGLGESVVSGLIEPDTFLVDKASGVVRECTIGTKENLVELENGPGTRETEVPEKLRDQISLTDEEVKELVSLAGAIEEIYQAPQEIEWAYAGNRLYILQSRPITGLNKV